MTKISFYLLLVGTILIYSCNSKLSLNWNIQNKTNEPLKLIVHYYYVGYIFSETDTIIQPYIELKPNERLSLGYLKHTGFPWETRKLYRRHPKPPGLSNFKIISGDTINVNCDEGWTYWRARSTFKIRHVP